LACAFVIPVVLAKVLLTVDFKGQVKTHGGELLTMAQTYPQLINEPPVDNQKNALQQSWRVAYFTENGCDKRCIDGLYHIQQTYKALGRLQERVSVDLLNSGAVEPSSIPDYLSFEMFSHHQVATALPPSLNNKVVIIDPHGNLVMSYQFNGEKQQNLSKAHDMLLDIKQLLKLSRIG